VITEDDLFAGLPSTRNEEATPPAASPVKLQSLKKAVEDLELKMIQQALHETRNNQQQAAKLLGLSRQGLINKMKRYSIAG
jgi:transcriptional regulator with PAS, ATPase and Fis domain